MRYAFEHLTTAANNEGKDEDNIFLQETRVYTERRDAHAVEQNAGLHARMQKY